MIVTKRALPRRTFLQMCQTEKTLKSLFFFVYRAGTRTLDLLNKIHLL